IATFKCLGAPAQVVVLIYLIQIAIIALGGILIGLVIGALSPMLAAQFLAQFLPVSTTPTLYPGALLLATLFGILTTLAFAILPLGHAREVPATALFREQGFEARRLPSWPYILLAALFMVALAGLAI
ncbi:FtsX-like permease family protein, partial [Rhizobium ruizarguesonis]